MGFLSRFLGGEKPARAKLTPQEEAAKEAAFQAARGKAQYTDPTGNLDLKLTEHGHVDATGQLPNAGYVPPKKEAEARTHFSQTADPTGGSEIKLTPEGHIDVDGYAIDPGTKEILDQFRVAQANERINGKGAEQQDQAKAAPTVRAAPGMKNEIL